MARKFIVDGAHLARLGKLCRMIGVVDGLSLVQIQTRLKASRRTVFRGIASLQALGIEVELRGGRYRTRLTHPVCRRIICSAVRAELEKLMQASLR